MKFCIIPETLEDLEKKRDWTGFKDALKVIGLDADEVKARLRQGKTPYDDLRNKDSNGRKHG